MISASDLKRWRNPGSWTSREATTLRAQISPSCTCRALKTAPMPPSPSLERISYLPRRTVPGLISVAACRSVPSSGQTATSSSNCFWQALQIFILTHPIYASRVGFEQRKIASGCSVGEETCGDGRGESGTHRREDAIYAKRPQIGTLAGRRQSKPPGAGGSEPGYFPR